MDLIETDAALAALCRTLAGANTVYLDTEFESAKAGKTLSLIQLGTGSGVFVVDALRLGRLEPLARAIALPHVTWVVHAGLQDLELLLERFGGKRAGRLFDTQIAWALLSPEASVSLAYLKYKLLGIRTMKTHQSDDWIRRPLPAAQLAYAASDIEHLPAIHRALLERLAVLGRDDAAETATEEQLLPEARDASHALSLDSFRNAWQLDPPEQAALRFLIEWYNDLTEAERRFAPLPKTLLAVASRLPTTKSELARIKGVNPRWSDQKGERLVRELRRAVRESESSEFVAIDPPAYATFEDIRLDGWLSHLRAEVSARTSIAPELAFNSRVMKTIRAAIIQSGGDRRAGEASLEGWRRRLLSEAYLDFVTPR